MNNRRETRMKLYVGTMNAFGNRVPYLKNLATILENRHYDDMTGTPGIITENPEGDHNVYGLHNPFEMLDTSYVRKLKYFDYGALESPEKLFSLLEEDRRDEKVINGCLIWIPDSYKSKVKKIIISPDNDLREKYDESFNQGLVESLNRTVSSYIEREGLSGQVIPAIQAKTLMMSGSPFSMKHWGRE